MRLNQQQQQQHEEGDTEAAATVNNNSHHRSSILIDPTSLYEQHSSMSYNETTPLFNRQHSNAFPIPYNTQTSDQAPNDYSFSLRKLLKFMGPGFLMSVAYLDPGNLESDLQTGATVGYKLLWVLLLATMIGFLLQSLAVRLGATTGYNLAEICRKEYHPFARYFLWIMIEIAIISSDIQQVIGTALAINILSQGYVPMWGAILITAADTFVFLFLENTGIRVLEAIFGVFISVMCGSFLYIYIRLAPPQLEIVKGFIPWCENCTYKEMKHLIGIVGSIVMPHNIYFHSTLVLSRNVDRRNDKAINEANKYYSIDSGCALFISFLCNIFVVSSFAKIFYGTNKHNTDNVTLADAGKYIGQEYGIAMQIIWAIGLLSAGQASTITGTYAGQFVMEGFTKISLPKWQRILIIRTITILISIIVALATYVSIDQVNFWCNVIQSIQLPFALLPILHFTASKRIMGPFKVHIIFQIFCYMIAAFIIGVNFYVVISLIIQSKKLVYYILCSSLLAVYAFVILYYSIGVNNAYRVGLFIRRFLCCTPNAHEIDELLHTSPVYTHPPKLIRTNQSNNSSSRSRQSRIRLSQQQQQSATQSRVNSLNASINQVVENEAQEEETNNDQQEQQQQNNQYAIRSNNLTFLADHFNNSSNSHHHPIA